MYSSIARSWYGILLAVILYVAVNTLVNVSVTSARLDVTEHSLYTLSPGTLASLARIDEPLELHFFYSEQLGRVVPAYANHARRVRELLNEITIASDKKITLLEYQMTPFSEAEDIAMSHGVQGIPVDQSGELVYFGLAASNAADETELIPFFEAEREAFLEYDLAQMIQTLSNTKPVVIGMMSSLPIMGDRQMQMQTGIMVPWTIVTKLKENFKISNLPEAIDSLPNDINVMMVVHPRAMNQRAIYQLEQFLFRGGRAILFMDPNAESDQSLGPNQATGSTNGLQPLFKQWGINIPAEQVVGDRTMGLRINAGTAARPFPAQYLPWLGVSADYMAQEDPVTSQLPALNIASAGGIFVEDNSPLKLEPLIFSSQNSGLINTAEINGSRPDIIALLENFNNDDSSYVIAGRLTGVVSTAFPEGPPSPTVEKSAQALIESPEPAQLMRSNGDINIIVVADTDLLEDRFWIQEQKFYGRTVEKEIAGNAKFVMNALGNLGGSDELIHLRSRGNSQRPFEKVQALQKRADERFQEKERALRLKLTETQDKIAKLQGVQALKDNASGDIKVTVSLTDEQRLEVEVLRKDMRNIRQQLREVQRNLRADIRTLETRLQFANISLVPIIILIIAILLAASRVAKRREFSRSKFTRSKVNSNE
jgi:ABC-type uncharacterized transport system involved in gliding motility auxiliary subunit